MLNHIPVQDQDYKHNSKDLKNLKKEKITLNLAQWCVTYSVKCMVKSDKFTVQQNALYVVSVIIHGLQNGLKY